MYLINCDCKDIYHNMDWNIGDSYISIDELIRIDVFLNIIEDKVKSTIYSYLGCDFSYNVIKSSRDFESGLKNCPFNDLYIKVMTKYYRGHYPGTCANFRSFYNFYARPKMSISNQLDPFPSKENLLDNNNIFSHIMAMKIYELSGIEIINMFNVWKSGKLEYCISPVSDNVLYELIQYDIEKDNDLIPKIFRYLFKIMYDTQDINPILNILTTIDKEIVNEYIIKSFQIPPHIVEKIIDIVDVSVLISHQSYIDKKVYIDKFNQLTEETCSDLTKLNLSPELVDKIIFKYPHLLDKFIISKLINMNQIILNKANISEYGWIYISNNYDIPDDKIKCISEFLNWKLYLYARTKKVKKTDSTIKNAKYKIKIRNPKYIDIPSKICASLGTSRDDYLASLFWESRTETCI